MCRLSMEHLGNSLTRVRVLSLEQEVSESCGGRHGTIDTVSYILRSDPTVIPHLVIGEDAYRDICLNKWKHGERLFELCRVHVIERLGAPPDGSHDCNIFIPSSGSRSISSSSPLSSLVSSPSPLPVCIPPKYRCYQRHHIPSLNNVSSTEIRAVSAFPYWPLPIENPLLVEELDPSVHSYLKSHGLYNFSEEVLWRQRRCRLYVLGLLSWTMLLWSTSEIEGIYRLGIILRSF
jgi:nicotinic acid mononucleotide adenylyltransferase